MPQATCPSPEALRRFLAGTLPFGENAMVEAHLSFCPECLSGDDLLGDPADAVAGAVRAAGAAFVPSPGLSSLMDRLRLLSPEHSTPCPSGHLTIPFSPPQAELPEMVGRYRIVGPLGAGGMGAVYRAFDTQLQRPVALKIPRFQGPDSGQAEARSRFLREARAAAAVRHAHVCPIHDVGEIHDTPYVVMSLIEGRSLAGLLAERKRIEDPREAVGLVYQVARGLQAVHDAGIIHRDLKPANILLDAKGQALLADFGLARSLNGDALTADGTLLGTPAYMAPEQVTFDGTPISNKTDLYALGVVLYQMVTGRTPYEGPVLHLIRKIEREVPPRPSEFRTDLDPALEEIIMRTLSRAPADRPASAADLADQLEGWLRRYPRGERARLAPKQAPLAPRRWLVAAVAAMVLFVVGIFIKYSDTDSKPRTNGIADKAPDTPDKDPQPKPPPPQTVGPISPFSLVPQPAKIDGVLGWTLESIGHRGPVTVLAYRRDGKQFASAGVDGTVRVWDPNGKLQHIVYRPGGKDGAYPAKPKVMVWSPNGKLLLVGDASGKVTIIDPLKDAPRTLYEEDLPITSLDWSPNGKAVLLSVAGRVRVLQMADCQEIFPVIRTTAWGATFNPDGRSIVASGATIEVYSFETGKLERTGTENVVFGNPLAWSPDGKWLAVSRKRVWEVTSAASFGIVEGAFDFQQANWSADSKTLYLIGSYGNLHLWDRATKKSSAVGMPGFDHQGNNPSAVAIGPSGVAVLAKIGRADLIGVSLGLDVKKRFEISGAGSLYGSPSPDGKTLVTRNDDKTLRLWDLKTGKRQQSRDEKVPRPRLAWALDGKTIWADTIREVATLQPTRDNPLAKVESAARELRIPVAWSPDGKKVATYSYGKTNQIHVYDTSSGNIIREWATKHNSVYGIAWSPDGTRLVVAFGADVTTFAVNGDKDELPKALGFAAWFPAWSADGKWLALGGPSLALYDAKTLKQRLLAKNLAAITPINTAFSPNSKRLVGLVDDDACIFETESGKCLQKFPLPASSPDGLPAIYPTASAWMPDDKTVAATLSTASVGFFDLPSGKLRGTIVGMPNGQGLAVSPNGHYRGTPKIEHDLVHVVRTKAGTAIMTPAEFAKRFGWKNDPERVNLASGR